MYSYGVKCLLALTLGWRYNLSIYGNGELSFVTALIQVFTVYLIFVGMPKSVLKMCICSGKEYWESLKCILFLHTLLLIADGKREYFN